MPHLSTHSVLTPDLGTTTSLAGWDCWTKDDTKLFTRLFDDFCPGALQYKWRRQYREKGYKGFNTWAFSYDNQAEIYKHAEYLQKWCPSLMENLPISERNREKKQFNFNKKKPKLDTKFSNDPS